MKSKKSRPTIENRRAKHDYFIEDTIDCGIVLKGNEIKSLISGMANLTGAYCDISNGELMLHNMYITKYDTANNYDVSERRSRKLLAHKREILKLSHKLDEKGYTLVPLKVFWDRQFVKIEIGLCRGKKNYDKRQSLKEHDIKRDIERHMS